MASILSAKVEVIGKELVEAKLLAAAPNILAQNRAMVTTMLGFIKPVVIQNTPLGPGHFGYHLRESFTTNVSSKGLVTNGVLKSPRTGYWREYGTGGRFRRAGTRRAFAAALGGFGTGGERAYMIAHHALVGINRFVKAYYGGMAAWWTSRRI